MNTVKIINNNVNGKSDGNNYFPNNDAYAIRVYSDTNAAPDIKIIVSNNSISGTYDSGIRSLSNSIINKNKISGNFTNYAIYCLQDSNVETNKVDASCQTSIYTTINSNIINNNISGFINYGIRAAGKNISGNIISRNEDQNIIGFIAGGTNGGQSGNQPTLVVDNVFSHDTINGSDKNVVKSATNWKVERNLPDYKISTPIINIRSVDNLDALAALTEMQHNEVVLVARNYDEIPSTREQGFGLWRFVKGSTKTESQLQDTHAIAIVKSSDNTGSWFWTDYSRLNAPMGIPRLDIFSTLKVSDDGINKIQVDKDHSIDGYGSSINLNDSSSFNLRSQSSINLEDTSTINLQKGSGIISAGGTIYGGYRLIVKFHTISEHESFVIKPGTDQWADHYIVDNKSDIENTGVIVVKSSGLDNIENYLGSRIRFAYNGADAAKGTLCPVITLDKDDSVQAQFGVVRSGGSNWNINLQKTNCLELVLVYNPINGVTGWHSVRYDFS